MKRAVVEYDEIGNPYKVVDIREFKDDSFPAFKALCDGNAKKREERLAEDRKEAEREEMEAKAKRNALSAWIARLWLERAMDVGEVSMTDEEYSAFLASFGEGRIETEEGLPETFCAVYDCLKEE